MRVDAHHHLWHYTADDFGWLTDDMAALRRDFLPHDLNAEMSTASVDLAIAVQARCSLEETRFLLQCATTSSRIAKVVGWAPLTSPDLPKVLDEFAGHPTLAGFREIAQDQPPGFLLDPAFNAGMRELTPRGYTYDLLIRAHQLTEAIAFVDRHPQQPFVLDHAGKPGIAGGHLEPWRTQLFELAQRPNVLCKLSGLVTEARWFTWTAADLEPYLNTCLEAFGPTRCMAGSDWPVCLVSSSYPRWWHLLETWTATLSGAEQQHVLGLTAASFYHLPLPTPEVPR